MFTSAEDYRIDDELGYVIPSNTAYAPELDARYRGNYPSIMYHVTPMRLQLIPREGETPKKILERWARTTKSVELNWHGSSMRRYLTNTRASEGQIFDSAKKQILISLVTSELHMATFYVGGLVIDRDGPKLVIGRHGSPEEYGLMSFHHLESELRLRLNIFWQWRGVKMVDLHFYRKPGKSLRLKDLPKYCKGVRARELYICDCGKPKYEICRDLLFSEQKAGEDFVVPTRSYRDMKVAETVDVSGLQVT